MQPFETQRILKTDSPGFRGRYEAEILDKENLPLKNLLPCDALQFL